MKVFVKINPKIAARGSGFSDIEGKQEIRPPYKDGKPVVNHVFKRESTPFVELKISTGELVLIKREEDPEAADGQKSSAGDVDLHVTVNGEAVSAVKVAQNEPEGKIKKAVFADKKVAAALKGKKVEGIEIKENAVAITTK